MLTDPTPTNPDGTQIANSRGAERRQHANRKQRATALALTLVIATMVLSTIYLIVRTVLFILTDLVWYEKLLSVALLFCEFFILMHGFGYFRNVINSIRAPQRATDDDWILPVLDSYPPIAVIVSSYREPIEIVENTLICFRNMTYPNKHLYFLDDTRYDVPAGQTPEMAQYRQDIDSMCQRLEVNMFRRKWHGAKAGMINDFLDFLAGRLKEGFVLSRFELFPSSEPEKYIAIFDADMNPLPDFAEGIVRRMEERPNLAFIQTPQYYTNFETNRVARAAGLQQVIFYEFICEGKSSQDAMFCCGTNVMFRREALEAVGGFDETSVTEDFATSMKFHMKGWNSAYLNKICAFGMGPQDLGGYFKQQFRWALGTVGLVRTTIGEIIANPKSLSPFKIWEYFVSGTHYFTGWVFFILWLAPVLYLFLGIPSFFAHPEIFLLIFFPYLTLTLFTFLFTLRQRGYSTKDLFIGVVLTTVCFPVYMKASAQAVMGVKGSFGITPKGGSTSLPLIAIWPQITTVVIAFVAIVWGINRFYYTGLDGPALLVNGLWCTYNMAIISVVFYFNNPEPDQ